MGLVSILNFQYLFLLLKKIGFPPWPGIVLRQAIFLLTLTLTVKSSFNDTIVLLVDNINQTIWHVVTLNDVTWFCFYFDFVHSLILILAPRGYCSIVFLRFHFAQIKQVDCKISAKTWIIINQIHLVIFFEQLHSQEYKATKK